MQKSRFSHTNFHTNFNRNAESRVTSDRPQICPSCLGPQMDPKKTCAEKMIMMTHSNAHAHAL